jgi:uncharacterized protein (UPF0212 family)
VKINKLAVPCAACNAAVEIDISENQRIINLETVSMLVIEHQGQLMCPGCGNVVMPVLKAIAGLMFQAMPVPPEQQNKLVLPANGRM